MCTTVVKKVSKIASLTKEKKLRSAIINIEEDRTKEDEDACKNRYFYAWEARILETL